MRQAALLALALLWPAVAMAQRPADPNEVSHAMTVIGRDSVSGQPCYVGTTATCQANPGGPGSSNSSPAYSAPVNATTTAAALTGSPTANTFSLALAASSTRKDCTIYSANAFSVSPGASPSAGTAIPVTAGYPFKCSDAAIVMGDQINVASATASNTYVVWSQ